MLVSVAERTGLSLTLSENPQDRFCHVEAQLYNVVKEYIMCSDFSPISNSNIIYHFEFFFCCEMSFHKLNLKFCFCIPVFQVLQD